MGDTNNVNVTPSAGCASKSKSGAGVEQAGTGSGRREERRDGEAVKLGKLAGVSTVP